MKEEKKIECPCCKNLTLPEKEPWYFICPICLWENDPIQFEDPDFTGGANEYSLNQARKNFIKAR